MQILEKKLISILQDLKENYCATGIKAEFETEGTTFNEALKLKEIIAKVGLNYTIKIGGCGAIKELCEVKTLKADSIVAPMIETPYAMEKYLQSIQSVFSEQEKQNFKFLIDVETITGYQNIDKIFSQKNIDNISGVVLGRNDLTQSMGIHETEVDSKRIFDIANTISAKMLEAKKEFIIGGRVSEKSLDFFSQLPYLSGYETRKVIFDAKALKNQNANQGLVKALEFEIMWLKNRHNFCNITYPEDMLRIKRLEGICSKIHTLI